MKHLWSMINDKTGYSIIKLLLKGIVQEYYYKISIKTTDLHGSVGSASLWVAFISCMLNKKNNPTLDALSWHSAWPHFLSLTLGLLEDIDRKV